MGLYLLLVVVVAWCVFAVRGLRRRRAWMRVAGRADDVARKRLQRGVPACSRDLSPGPVWLSGVLRAPAPLTSRERGSRRGSPLSRAAADTRGSADLSIDVDGHTVAIGQPVRVWVGADQRFGCRVTRRLLRGADRVLVRGVLSSTATTVDYRSAQQRSWRLEPEREAVALAAAGEARNRLAPTLTLWLGAGRPAVAVSLLLATVVAAGLTVRDVWKDRRALACGPDAGCANDGLCGARWAGLGFACAATEDAHCVEAAACRDHNRCAARAGVCQVKDCSGVDCVTDGACTAQGTRCVASSDADCLPSWNCRQRGLCSERNGRCVLTVDQRRDCSTSISCPSHGLCSSTPQGCLAATREDCLQSEEACQVRGRCTPDGFGLCRAMSDADCADSQVCRELGFCTAIDGGCAASRADPCGASAECDYRAKCASIDGACVPTRDAHCRLSVLCWFYDRCRVEGQDCVE